MASRLRISIMIMILSGWSISAWNSDLKRRITIDDNPVPVRAVLVDSNGIKWFGTDRGLYKFDNHVWSYYENTDYLSGKLVTALVPNNQEAENKLNMATNEGIGILTFDAHDITNVHNFNMDQGLLDDSITSIIIDSFQRLYCGSEQGISVIDLGSVEYLTYSEYPASMIDAPVNTMYLYKDTIYIGADGGIGRFMTNVDGISGASSWTSEYGITPLSGNIKSIFIDAEGHQWFGTDQGVEEHIGTEAKKNWLLYTTSDGLINNYVQAITEDLNGGMWFGTKGGASYLLGENWTNYSSEDGLASDTIYSIGIDLDGSVWFGTHRGVSHLKGSKFETIFTGVHETYQKPSDLVATYDQITDEIRISFHAQKPGNNIVHLYSIDGRLIIRSEYWNSEIGQTEFRFPARINSQKLLPGMYILNLSHQEESSSARIMIP